MTKGRTKDAYLAGGLLDGTCRVSHQVEITLEQIYFSADLLELRCIDQICSLAEFGCIETVLALAELAELLKLTVAN